MLVRNPVHKKNQKIIMLIPNLDFGGAQRVFHDHAKVLAEKFEVIECAFNMKHGHAYPTGNRIISLEVPGGMSILDKVWQFLCRCWKLYKLKAKEEADMTISHLEGADYVNILSFGPGRKVLVVHGSKLYDREIDHSYGWIRKKILLPLLYRQADLIVTVSEGIRHELIDAFKLNPRKIVTIYNFFSLENLKNKAGYILRLPLEKNKQKFRLVTSGRLVTQKNQLPLLHIVKTLRDEYLLPVQLFFVGDGPLKSDLEQEATALHLSVKACDHIEEAGDEAVIFLGYQTNPFQYYSSMDLFVFPSAWEGFPMALGEAMALNLPVVSADCPTGPLELLHPEWQQSPPIRTYPFYTAYGVLLPVPDNKDKASVILWASTIAGLLRDKNLRYAMGKAAGSRMLLLDEQLMKDRWLNINRLMYG